MQITPQNAAWIFLAVAIVLLAKASTLPRRQWPKKSIPGMVCLLISGFFFII